MALTLELAQTVAVGPFNSHIITPEWLVRCNVLPEQEIQIRFGTIGDGTAFRFGKIEWQVNSRRLMVSTSTLTEDCGDLVAKVLELLPHTPVRAVGHNFHFLCNSREEWRSSPVPALGTKEFGDFTDLVQSRWTGIFQKSGVRIELTIGYADDGVVVLLNHHRITNTIEEAQEAARQFRRDLDVSRAYLGDLLKQELRDV